MEIGESSVTSSVSSTHSSAIQFRSLLSDELTDVDHEYFTSIPTVVTPDAEDAEVPESAETVTVKFITSTGEIFTKAFDRSNNIYDIKQQLANLFNLKTEQVHIGKNQDILNDNVKLSQLGVKPLGSIELNVEMNSSFVLNYDLIYGYISTVDVINVQNVNGVELVVEIEHQREEKEWLGGYKHRITKKEYHHASTQTQNNEPNMLKISRCLQVPEHKDASTNTFITKRIQTSWIPNIEDKIIRPRRNLWKLLESDDEIEPNKHPISSFLKNLAVQENSTANIHNELAYNIENVEKSTEREKRKIYPETVYNEIMRWNRNENQKLHSLNESDRLSQRVDIFNHTREFLSIVDEEIRKLNKTRRREKEKRILSIVAAPKTFISRNGKRICMETVLSQQIQRLKVLYDNYDNYDNNVQPLEKIKAVIELQNFFWQNLDYEFANDIVELLQTELNLITRRLMSSSALKERIQQYILDYVKQCRINAPPKINYFPQNIDKRLYRDMLMNVQNNEIEHFKCFTSVCFRMRVSEMYYLVSEIWQNRSIISECTDLLQLTMTRWLITADWSPDNCILLTKYEMKKHLKTDIAEYDKCFQSKVRNNHLKAKLHFCKMLSV